MQTFYVDESPPATGADENFISNESAEHTLLKTRNPRVTNHNSHYFENQVSPESRRRLRNSMPTGIFTKVHQIAVVVGSISAIICAFLFANLVPPDWQTLTSLRGVPLSVMFATLLGIAVGFVIGVVPVYILAEYAYQASKRSAG
ncbi:MAG: hypothetical protein IAF58_03625 [Leptolyngbya sp.]|nr:hypothetical protein [Candidatus Melainabacteria bacterium]